MVPVYLGLRVSGLCGVFKDSHRTVLEKKTVGNPANCGSDFVKNRYIETSDGMAFFCSVAAG